MIVEWEPFMVLALAEAKLAMEKSGDVPVGALLLSKNLEIVSRGRNERELLSDPTAHAEIQAIRQASSLVGDWRLNEMTMVVTLEPCVMCAAAIQAARIRRLVFGAWDEKAGGSGSVYDLVRDRRLGNPAEVIAGVSEGAAKNLLLDFFSSQR